MYYLQKSVCREPHRYKLEVNTGSDAQTQTDVLLCQCGTQDTENSHVAEVQRLQKENEVTTTTSVQLDALCSGRQQMYASVFELSFVFTSK